MKDIIAKNTKSLPSSGIREFFDLVLETKGVVSLGVGEPDFVTSWKIREKAIYSLEQGYTSYTSNKGLYRLRLEIANFLKRQYNLTYNAKSQILVTAGVSQGLDLAVRAIVNPRDKVLVVYPSYVSYPAVVQLARGQVVGLNTREEDGFKITPERLYSIVKKTKPKTVILNYPSNPTGVSYTKPELKEIWKVLSKEGVLVISDEIYDLISFDYKHTPFASLRGAKKRTVYLGGFSKNYAMTGLRVGFVCADPELIEQMTKINSYVMICPAIISQLAAVDALGTYKEVNAMVKEYKRRRSYIIKELSDLGLHSPLPQGAFYCFASVKRTGMSSLEFAKRLLKEVKVAVVPGQAFGKGYENYIRISFACPFGGLKEAITRIRKFLKRHENK